MKKTIFAGMFALLATSAFAQKFAYVDTDYIMKSIPAYESAQDGLPICQKRFAQICWRPSTRLETTQA